MASSSPIHQVIGDQSVGKTTVLELLSGIQLPRGDGIVTRCPLELRLHELEDEGEPYALISSAEHDERRCSLGEVERVVVEMTNELAGTSLSVVDKPIYVSVYRQDVLDLTVRPAMRGTFLLFLQVFFV